MKLDDPTTLPIEQVHPTLRPVVQQFLLKCKYPFHMFGNGRWLLAEEDGEHKQFSSAVVFYDPNAETMQQAGALKWQHGDFGKPAKFRVVTRSVINPKYRDSERQRSIETGDPKRALKEMLTCITPFTLPEIARASNSYADNNIHRWKVDAQHVVAQYFNISNDVLVREIQNLIAQGVMFDTVEFQEMVTQGIPAYYESKQRSGAKINKHFVKFERNGMISVMSPNGQSSFTAFDMLPSFIQETVGMLKLMRTSDTDQPSIPGVGVQINENTFWVFEQVERTGA